MAADNEYHTPEDTPRYFADKLALNTRMYFVCRYIAIILSTRKAAMKGLYDTQAWVDSSLRILRLIEGCGGRFHITGLDYIRNSEGPVVFLSNHMSSLETMVFPGVIQPLKDIAFVVKDTLVKHVAFGPVMRSRQPIVLGRENPREDFRIVMEQGTDYLNKGKSIVIFPQSTRRIMFKPSEFNSIGTKLAAKNGVKVIPVAIKTDFWGNGRYTGYLGHIDRKKPIHFAFGEPIPVQGTGKTEHQYIVDYISDHLKQWGQ